MANKQINELSELTTISGVDLVAVYDMDEAGSEKTKKVTASHFQWTYTPTIATTAGTTVELTTAIPAWATEIDVIMNEVSTNTGSQPPIIRLGDAGGVESAGYTSSSTNMNGVNTQEENDTDGIHCVADSIYTAGSYVAGAVRMTRWDPSQHLWFFGGVAIRTGVATNTITGGKTLSAALTTIQLTTPGGSATFDAGEARVRYR